MRGHLCVLLLTLLPVSEASAQHHVELILDASGSMYNKLEDGRYRISAAKEVLEAFVKALPAVRGLERRLAGLWLPACAGTILPPARIRSSSFPISGVDRDGLLAAIRSTRAKGSTPIAYSLRAGGRGLPRRFEELLDRAGHRRRGGLRWGLEGECRKASRAGVRGRSAHHRVRLDPGGNRGASRGWGRSRMPRDATALAAALDRAVEDIVEREPLGEATLSAPPQVAAGAPFEVSWRAEEGPRDYVTIVEAGAKDGKYGSYAYTRGGNPVTLHAPITSGGIRAAVPERPGWGRSGAPSDWRDTGRDRSRGDAGDSGGSAVRGEVARSRRRAGLRHDRGGGGRRRKVLPIRLYERRVPSSPARADSSRCVPAALPERPDERRLCPPGPSSSRPLRFDSKGPHRSWQGRASMCSGRGLTATRTTSPS